MSKYAALLGQITIDASNKAIRMTEGATTETVNIAEGTYFLRGDGAAGDFCPALVTALASNTNATTPNTYTVTIALSADPTAASCVVTIARATGSSTFQILWSDALTTFDEGLLGFEDDDTANDATDKVSTLSPSALWVSPDVLTFYEPEEEYNVTIIRSRPGRLKGQRTGGPFDLRRVSIDFVDAARVFAASNLYDPTAAFDVFHERVGDGKRIELHAVALSSGTTLAALSASTEIGNCWHFDEETATAFEPSRLEPGLALYRIDLGLMGFVA